MLARLMRDGGVLYFLLAIYFAVNAALRIALGGSLELEESRLLFLSQWLEPSYSGQAPLAVWMQYWVTHMLGANVLSVILLENLLLFLAYVFVGWAAFQVIRNRALAIIAVFGMVLLPQVVYELQRDGGAWAATLMATAFFLAGVFAMLGRGSLFAYVLAGLGIGLGFLASYDFVLTFVAALICMLMERSFRARLADWRIIFTLFFASAVLATFIPWLRDSIELSEIETLTRGPQFPRYDQSNQIIEGLFSLAAALFGFFVPVILVFWFAFGRRFLQSRRASSPWTRLIARILFLVLLALLAMIVLGGAAVIYDRWLVPFFFIVPLYFSLKLEALNQTIGNAPKRFGAIAVLILIAVPVLLAGRVPAAHWTGRYTHINQPPVDVILATGQHPPSVIFAEDAALGGNVRLAAKDIPVITPGTSRFAKGSVFDATHPLLIIWRSETGDVPIPEPLSRLLVPKQLSHLMAFQAEAGTLRLQPQYIALPYHFGKTGDVYRYGYAWVYPPTP